MTPVWQGVLTVTLGLGGCLLYFWGSNRILDTLLFPPRGPQAWRNIARANLVRPWLFLAPAVLAMGVYLAYPVAATLWLSVTDRAQGEAFVGLENYRRMAAEPKFWEAMSNNLLWLIVIPAVSTAIGLLAARLTDRLGWGALARSLIFMPMAISFVGAAVIWKLVYDARPAAQEQIGLLNALWLGLKGGPLSVLLLKLVPSVAILALLAFVLWLLWRITAPLRRIRPLSATGWLFCAIAALAAVSMASLALLGLFEIAVADFPYGQPQVWLTKPILNSFLLMAVLVWIQTGFAIVVFSAALRGIPEEIIEAAIVDGASPWQVFFQVQVPQIRTTIVVVWTVITLVVLRVFDIVLAMTNGQWGTQVLANYMYDKMFRAFDLGVGSAAAVVILLLVLPILIWNLRAGRRALR